MMGPSPAQEVEWEEVRAYGLNDPSLEGFNPFKVIAAPFKAAAKVATFGVKTAVRVAPRAAAGFLTAGPAGAIAGGATGLIPRPAGPPPATPQYGATGYPGFAPGSYPRSNPTLNPYGGTASPFGQVYANPAPPQPDFASQAGNVLALLKSELLKTGGRYIAGTPEGQAGIRQRVAGDIGSYMLPISIGAGALILTIALMRR